MDDIIEVAVSLDDRASTAKHSKDETERLIEEFMPFLNARANRYSSRLEQSQRDDLFSAAMMAFYEALQNYDISKGHFFTFANHVVTDRIIDCIRSNERKKILSVPLEEDDDDKNMAQSSELSEISFRIYKEHRTQESLADEIKQFEAELSTWGITFNALVKHSPKHQKLRETYKMVVSRICQTPDIVQTIHIKRYFPVKAVATLTGLPQKTLERARIFILASVLIALGDYDYLSEYVNSGR